MRIILFKIEKVAFYLGLEGKFAIHALMSSTSPIMMAYYSLAT